MMSFDILNRITDSFNTFFFFSKIVTVKSFTRKLKGRVNDMNGSFLKGKRGKFSTTPEKLEIEDR